MTCTYEKTLNHSFILSFVANSAQSVTGQHRFNPDEELLMTVTP